MVMVKKLAITSCFALTILFSSFSADLILILDHEKSTKQDGKYLYYVEKTNKNRVYQIASFETITSKLGTFGGHNLLPYKKPIIQTPKELYLKRIKGVKEIATQKVIMRDTLYYDKNTKTFYDVLAGMIMLYKKSAGFQAIE